MAQTSTQITFFRDTPLKKLNYLTWETRRRSYQNFGAKICQIYDMKITPWLKQFSWNETRKVFTIHRLSCFWVRKQAMPSFWNAENERVSRLPARSFLRCGAGRWWKMIIMRRAQEVWARASKRARERFAWQKWWMLRRRASRRAAFVKVGKRNRTKLSVRGARVICKKQVIALG